MALGEHQQVLGEGLLVHSTFVSWSKEVQLNAFTSLSANNWVVIIKTFNF